jgi:hypothetical protein
MSQDGKEDGTNQQGFINTVLSVLSGTRRGRSPAISSASSTNSDNRDQNASHSDEEGFQGIPPDGILSLDKGDEDVTFPHEKSPMGEGNFRYDGGSQTLTNGGSSSGFRYFKNIEDGPSLVSSAVKKAGNAGDGSQGNAGDDNQGKRLLSDLLSPVRDQPKTGGYLSELPFPLSRPAAGYGDLNVSSFEDPRPHARDGNFQGGLDDFSVARLGQRNPQNVTQRDTKRPKERPRDRVYRQRFSMGGSLVPDYRSNVVFRQHHDPGLTGDGKSLKDTPAPSGFGHLEHGVHQSSLPPRNGSNLSSDGVFEIFLTFSGGTVVHRVWDTMSIGQLTYEAGIVFNIDHQDITLILFSGPQGPTSIPRTGRVSGPPRVSPGSNVFVFCVPGQRQQLPAPPTHDHVNRESSLSGLSPKLLASFKLPKFDGVARNWKAWEKAFTRFLGIHQLDHVLEENFLDSLWTVPGAKAANKMVFFLVEDAVATGTLASRLVRQATKWNGHEAYVMLRNGYVFNGPQTATILLAELSRIRLKRDEDASTFCFRLVELIEDLELIPGDAAVFLTDTQKLGYLLSAIRHESSLQSVYVQLQSEQLRGTVTFDRACQELHHRVEAIKADEYLDNRPGRALLSTQDKKNGQNGVPVVKLPCLAKDCAELIQPYLPLCKLCYLQCMAGKIPSLTLRDNLGNATFNSRTKMLDFPPAVPQTRFPKKGMKKGKKILMGGFPRSNGESSSE